MMNKQVRRHGSESSDADYDVDTDFDTDVHIKFGIGGRWTVMIERSHTRTLS
jgi:hypothetical protein